ncbi:hypothetical protein OG342_38120 [Streptomyces bobili]|uniref:hypothetical protein n=1 Tax=Streptomyces bobili TaxID=67280 RepID=UPI00225ACD27|nr:hypothetical protein [Streptomyces bobili]MCX5528603.1 hypothetical protein [Streptomyces bobili]
MRQFADGVELTAGEIADGRAEAVGCFASKHLGSGAQAEHMTSLRRPGVTSAGRIPVRQIVAARDGPPPAETLSDRTP